MILETYSNERRPTVGDVVYDAITGEVGTVERDLPYPYGYPVEILFPKNANRARAVPSLVHRGLPQVLLVVDQAECRQEPHEVKDFAPAVRAGEFCILAAKTSAGKTVLGSTSEHVWLKCKLLSIEELRKESE